MVSLTFDMHAYIFSFFPFLFPFKIRAYGLFSYLGINGISFDFGVRFGTNFCFLNLIFACGMFELGFAYLDFVGISRLFVWAKKFVMF